MSLHLRYKSYLHIWAVIAIFQVYYLAVVLMQGARGDKLEQRRRSGQTQSEILVQLKKRSLEFKCRSVKYQKSDATRIFFLKDMEKGKRKEKETIP